MGANMIAAVAVGLAVMLWWPPGAARLASGVNTLRPAQGVDRPGRRRQIASAVAVGAAAAFAAASWGWAALVVGLVAGIASFFVLGQLQTAVDQKRHAAMVAGLPQVCDLILVCLDAGLPIRGAVGAVADTVAGPLGEALSEAVAKVGLGIDEQRAWAELAEHPPLAKLGRELSRGAATGVSLTQRLAELGAEARKSAGAAAETAARKVGVSSVLPLMICFLPAFVLLGLVPIVGGFVLKFFG